MNEAIKQELHQLVDNCDNELLPEDAPELLQSGKDWWDDLSEKDQNLVMESEAEYKKGNFISHNQLMQRINAMR